MDMDMDMDTGTDDSVDCKQRNNTRANSKGSRLLTSY